MSLRASSTQWVDMNFNSHTVMSTHEVVTHFEKASCQHTVCEWPHTDSYNQFALWQRGDIQQRK